MTNFRMINQPHFDVFLAHNSQDKPQVRTIATKLSERGLKVWLDEDQIPPGQPFQDVIQQAIQNVRAAAIFIGSGGLGRWQRLELRALISQFVDADIPVIPVLLPGVDRIPRDLSFLQDLNWVSFANGLDDEEALNRLVRGITQQHPTVLPQTSGDFDVLLFYNDEDNQEVQPIIDQLREQQIQLWLTQEVRGGNAWQQVLETQLAQINSVAVFIGRSGSLWKREQIEPFIWEFIEQGRPVIPVILPNVLQEPELPIYLRRRTRVDFRQQDPNPTDQLIRGITGNRPTPSPQIDPISPQIDPISPQIDPISPPLVFIWSNFRLLMVLLIGMTIGITGTLIALKAFYPSQANLGTHICFDDGNNLVNKDNISNKKDGIQAFAKGDFQTAINKLKLSRQTNLSDPEVLIYLKNAEAASDGIRQTIKIAVSVPVGNNQNIAQEILRGVAQAQDEVNQNGGIEQKLLQVKITNDNNEPKLAAKIADELVKDATILAVVGHNSSEASKAAAPIYQKGGLVMITPTSDADSLREYGSPIFYTTPKIRDTAKQLTNYAIKAAHKNNIAICFDSKATASKTLKGEFEDAIKDAGGKIVSTDCNFSNPNFKPSTIWSNVINNKADSILLLPGVNTIDKAINIAQANRGRLTLLGSHTLNVHRTLKQGRCDVNGMVVAVPWNPTTDQVKAFADRAKKLWGGSVNWRTAMAYDATLAIITGLKRGSNTRDGLKNVLSDENFSVDGATGKIKFQDDRKTSVSLLKVQPSEGTDTGYDFVPFQP